jgi:ribose transport system ATP-binding protein
MQMEPSVPTAVDPAPAASIDPVAPGPLPVPADGVAAEAASVASTPLLEVRGLSKAFPGVQALSAVSLELRAGEVLALLGENGAGKSTLIKCLTGLYQPDEGQFFIDGHEVRFRSPQEAFQHGISVVPQERNLVPRFTVGENIMLEALPSAGGVFINYERVHREAQKWLDLLDVAIDSRTLVTELSVAQMQLVEIARAMSRESRILLLDEPTASISPRETQILFDRVRRLSDLGVAIVFVSHKLEEVFELCDQIAVLRDGRNAGPKAAACDMDRDKVVTLMVGRAEVTRELPARTGGRGGPLLELRGVYTDSGAEDVTLTVNRGEIVGLYGLVGSGRSELAKAIIGAYRITAGEVLVDGKAVRISSPGDALDHHGIGYVSENRKEEGLIQIHSVLSNVSITVWRRLQNAFGWVAGRAERTAVKPYVEKLDIKTPSLSTPVGSLSGGNQQKVSLAKWLTAGAQVLIIDEPTVGIDVRTKGNLHELIWDLASQGHAILLISSDMPEMVRLADRIEVMREGRIVGSIENSHDYADVSQQIMGFIH